jgi:hypothetical protein
MGKTNRTNAETIFPSVRSSVFFFMIHPPKKALPAHRLFKQTLNLNFADVDTASVKVDLYNLIKYYQMRFFSTSPAGGYFTS